MFDLVELFRWADPRAASAASERINLRYFTHRIDQLIQVLRQQAGQSGQTSKIDFISELLTSEAGDVQSEIVHAPELAFRLSHDGPQQIECVSSFVGSSLSARQKLREPDGASAAHGAWSALGEFYVPFCSSDQDPLATDSWIGPDHALYQSPTTDQGIVLDYYSPFAKRTPRANNFRPSFMETVKIEPEQACEITEKIRKANGSLASYCASAAQLVADSIKVVMPRLDQGIGNYQGGSSRSFMGRANLLNPHLDYITSDNIASSLVHESIHIMLYKIEIWQSPCTSLEELYRPSRISPWTGQTIHLLAFIHASFVWYGLLNFWRHAGKGSAAINPVAKYYIETAINGFHGPAFMKLIDDNRAIINPILSEQLSALHRAC